jgi:hypothetical protein
MAGPFPRSTESTCPAEKAWRHVVRHGAPSQLHVFHVMYIDFWLSPSHNHACCLSLYTTFTLRLDAQDLSRLLIFGCNIVRAKSNILFDLRELVVPLYKTPLTGLMKRCHNLLSKHLELRHSLRLFGPQDQDKEVGTCLPVVLHPC